LLNPTLDKEQCIRLVLWKIPHFFIGFILSNYCILSRVNELFDITCEDDDLLVIHKPAGLVCHPTKCGEYCGLISRARIHLKMAFEPCVVSRIVREASDFVLITKGTVAADSWAQFWKYIPWR
jgi:23S rRNA-/tRNA-specific pseudouridylate synthase